MTETAGKLSETSFAKVWDNPDDADAYQQVLNGVPDVPAEDYDAIPEDLRKHFK